MIILFQVVFGEKNFIKDWMKLSGKVSKPHIEHPKKKISGLECNRTEISGKKFWGFFKKLCVTPEQFFKHSFVYNHCCLAFMDATGKNITPPEIKVCLRFCMICTKNILMRSAT